MDRYLPVLAGSAAYAFGESQGWKCGLENKPWEAVGFYCVIIAATILGIGFFFARSNQSAVLERRHQRLRGCTRYGSHDVGWQSARPDGPLHGCSPYPHPRLGNDRHHGGGRHCHAAVLNFAQVAVDMGKGLFADGLVITGSETDVCVLGTVLGAVDVGYRVIIVRDAICSSSDQGHDALMEVYHSRFSEQIETANADEILDAWS